MLLVLATAAASTAVALLGLSTQIDLAAQRRIIDGAAVFHQQLADQRDSLATLGEQLLGSSAFVAAVDSHRADDVERILAFAIGVTRVDEAIVADTNGRVWAGRRLGAPIATPRSIEDDAGLTAAIEHRHADGIGLDESGSVAYRWYVPLVDASGTSLIGMLRLAIVTDNGDLELFKQRTGLDASLFYEDQRVTTTLRLPNGTPLTDVGLNPAAGRQVLNGGEPLLATRNLPIGEVRTYYTPLVGPDGARRGIFASALPTATINAQILNALMPEVPVTAGIMLAGVILAYFVARGVRQPVLALANAATRLRDGDLSTPIPGVEAPELAPLAQELERTRQAMGARLEAAAREDARQRALFAALRDPVLTASPTGQILDCNPAADALFGGSGLLRGRQVGELLPFVDSHSDLEEGDEQWHGTVNEPSGRNLDVEVTRTRLIEASAPPVDIFVVHDVSRHAELNRLREELLHDVAHELRGPLTNLESALELLTAYAGDLTVQDHERTTGIARRNAARLSAVVDDLLSASSIHAGRFEISAAPTRLRDMVAEAADLVRPSLEVRQQALRTGPGVAGLSVLADPRRAVHILLNLLNNASKFSPEGSEILVDAARHGPEVTVRVCDHGAGIPAEQLGRLFERFYRGASTPAQPGVGLGLAIAKAMVEAHDGRIGVDSQVGSGTTVWFTLPAVESV
jgi:signal transduction histidine kinase